MTDVRLQQGIFPLPEEKTSDENDKMSQSISSKDNFSFF